MVTSKIFYRIVSILYNNSYNAFIMPSSGYVNEEDMCFESVRKTFSVLILPHL